MPYRSEDIVLLFAGGGSPLVSWICEQKRVYIHINIHVKFPTYSTDLNKDNFFERKVYRRILGPVYGKEKENLKILTNKQIYAMTKNPL
jgi:hypothetical protein